MADVVNLRRFRKTRDRAERAEAASRNRAAFGRTAAEREASAEGRARGDRSLDGHRLVTPGSGGRAGDEPAG